MFWKKLKAGKKEEQSASKVRKAQILEILSLLRKKMVSVPNFDGLVGKLDGAILKLREMEVKDSAALSSLDNFLLSVASDSMTYLNRGNYLALNACIDSIGSLIDDRFMTNDCYADPEFIKFKLQRNRLYIVRQTQMYEYDKLSKRAERLKADAQNPELKSSKENIITEVMRIKDESQRIKSQIIEIDEKIQLLDKAIHEIKAQSGESVDDEPAVSIDDDLFNF